MRSVTAGVSLALVLVGLGTAPAYAATNVICVGSPGGSCNQTAASISAAITAAGANAVDDVIRVGPGTYSDGPYQLNGATHAITLQGSGPSTVITLPAGGAQAYVTANAATVRDLKVVMSPTTSTSDIGVYAGTAATVSNVTVDGTGATDAFGLSLRGSSVDHATVTMTGSGSTAAYSDGGGSTITDSTLSAVSRTFNHSGTGDANVISRSTLSAPAGYAATTDSGDIALDDVVVDLGSGSGAGLVAANFNNSTTPRSIEADHVTIVGGGAGSIGVWAYAATPGALQSTVVTLANSIVYGPETSLRADAGNDGSQGGSSSATLDVSYSDYQTTGGTIGANGTGGVAVGAGVVHAAPGFVSAASGNLRLAPGSALIDAGNPAAGGPATDRDGKARVVDGNGDGTAVRDMGAYEYVDRTPPQTQLVAKPRRVVRKASVRLRFRSEPGATFQCRRDARPWRACTSPATFKVSKGRHVIRVRARDGAGNVDPTPVVVRFRRR